MKRTTLKRTSLKRKPTNKAMLFIVDSVLKVYKYSEVFINIWNKRVHKCESCGVPLGNEAKKYMFDHLLEKSVYPELAEEEINIFLCCLDCHTKKTAGHPTEIHLKAINQIKQIYDINI